jgi:SP family facilitated glucose transporter-like MFS transporter 3
MDPRGRRAGVQLAAAGYLIGSLVLALADSVNALIVGRSAIFHFIEISHSSLSRFFKGLAAGLGLCVIPPFLSEISPPKVRGVVGKPDPEEMVLTEHKQFK